MNKKLLTFLTFACMLVPSFICKAQDTDECMLYMSYYQEYFKQGTAESRKAALPSWRKAYSICAPGTRQNLYVHGAALYRMLILQNAGNPAYQTELIDTLMTLHRLRAQYYPKYADKAYAAFGADVNNFLKKDPEKAHKFASEILEIQEGKTQPVVYVVLMNSAVSLYKEGKITAEDVINDYEKASSAFSVYQQSDSTQNTKNLRTTFENAFINSKIASCENLITLFDSRFDSCKDDYAAVSKIAKLMATADDCTDNDLYLKAVTQMHRLQPNYSSAYYLYRLYNSKDIYDKALKYLEEACSSSELDQATKAQYNYELAALYLKSSGHQAQAIAAANTAISADNSLAGRSYMLIGHAWMSSNCGGNEVEKRAKYWVAVDNFKKAKAADSSLAETADKQISQCAAFFPQKSEAFMYNIQDGETFHVSCGNLKATTTVRTN